MVTRLCACIEMDALAETRALCVLQVMKTEWNLMVNEVDVMWGQVHADLHTYIHTYIHTYVLTHY